MITTIAEFIQKCEGATNDEIYNMFEDECSEAVRAAVYFFADLSDPEPFRSAMNNLGFTEY